MNIVIILGEKLNRDGSISSILKHRLDKFINMRNKRKYNIIVSGGKVEKKAHHTEAYKMKKYLINIGNISKDKIITENKSQNTIENALFLKKIISKYSNIKSITIITSKFHIKRVKYIFNYYFKTLNTTIHFLASKNGLTSTQTKIRESYEKKYLTQFLNNIE